MSDYHIEYRRAPDPLAEARDRALRQAEARERATRERAWIAAWIAAGIDPLDVGDASRGDEQL